MESLLIKIDADNHLIYGNPMTSAVYSIDGLIVKTMSVRDEDITEVMRQMHLASLASSHVEEGRCNYFPRMYASGQVPEEILKMKDWELKDETMQYMVMEDCGMALSDYFLSISPEDPYPEEMHPSRLVDEIMKIYRYMVKELGLLPTDIHLDNIIISSDEEGYIFKMVDFENVEPVEDADCNVLTGYIIDSINEVAPIEYILQFPNFVWDRYHLSRNRYISVAMMKAIDDLVSVSGSWDWYQVTSNCSIEEIMQYPDLPWDKDALSYL